MATYVAGCSSSTSPSTDFDPQATATDVQAVVAAFQANQDAFASMSVASQALGASLAGQMLPKDPGQIMPSAAQVQALAKDLTTQAIFPSNYLGTTFVYDPAQAVYVQSDQTGAPSNGVRVIYYAIDPMTNMPATPLNALGYIDLTDETTAQSTRLGITIVKTGSSDVTLADYYVDVSYTSTQTDMSATLASVGYVSNGTDELDFDLTETLGLSQTSGVSINLDYQASLAGQDISVHFQADGTIDLQTDSPGTMNATFTIQNGSDQAVLTVSFTGDNTISGTLAYNGSTVVNISGTGDSPTFTKPDGSAVSQSDLTALQSVWNGVGNLFDFVGQLFGPAGTSA